MDTATAETGWTNLNPRWYARRNNAPVADFFAAIAHQFHNTEQAVAQCNRIVAKLEESLVFDLGCLFSMYKTQFIDILRDGPPGFPPVSDALANTIEGLTQFKFQQQELSPIELHLPHTYHHTSNHTSTYPYHHASPPRLYVY